MKKISLSVMLFLSITGIVFAQKIENYSNPRIWEQRLEIPFENNGKLIVTSNYAPLALMADRINIDSVFQQFWSKYEMLEEEKENVDAKTYLYIYDKASKKEMMVLKKYPSNSHTYGVIEGTEVVKLKTEQDTLLLSLQYDFFPFKDNRLVESKLLKEGKYILNYIFVVNSLEELKKLDKKPLNLQIREALKGRNESGESFKRPNERWVISKQNGVFKTNFYFNGMKDVIELGANFGGGWIRNQFTSSISTKFDVRIDKLSIGIGTDQIYTFRESSDTKKFNVYSSTFVSARFGFFSKNETAYKDVPLSYSYKSGVAIGYLNKDESGYFGNKTIRLAGMIPLGKHFNFTPEFYYSISNKQFYPGIRFNIF